jgi:hypothetical protein
VGSQCESDKDAERDYHMGIRSHVAVHQRHTWTLASISGVVPLAEISHTKSDKYCDAVYQVSRKHLRLSLPLPCRAVEVTIVNTSVKARGGRSHVAAPRRSEAISLRSLTNILGPAYGQSGEFFGRNL